MGWFDDQIEYRKKHERELLADSFEQISRSVTGRKISNEYREGVDVNDAISQLLKYFRVKEKETPGKLNTLEQKLDYLLGSAGILYREVELTPGWHKDSMGALITSMSEDGSVVTVLPGDMGGYIYVDPHTGKKVKVTSGEEKKLSREALCFYRPFPMRKITLKDMFGYMIECLTPWDYISFGEVSLLITLVGMLLPKINNILFGRVIESGSYRLLYAVMSFALFATVGNLILSSVKALLLSRIKIKLSVNVNAASMMRVLSLPADFFKNYSAGELNTYLGYFASLSNVLVEALFSTAVTGLFSLVYLTQIFQYASSLVLPSILVTVLTLVIGIVSSLMQISINKEKMKIGAEEQGLMYSLITGIQKIRLSGAENRAFIKWTGLFSKLAELTYNPPCFIKTSSVITSAISLIGTAVMYYIAVTTKVSVADYYAFNAAYAYISGAFSSVASIALTVATIRPSLEIVKPLMEAEPEITEGRETVTSLSGRIELSHVSFRYESDGPLILDDLNLVIPARQYVAIVGKSGCGKSTLLRLLLGFENPTKGAIYYDKRDIQRLDMHSVRQLIGTVMQNGKLFTDSIFQNIVISAPTLKLSDAWEAAEIADIADDIRAMPMGMNTMISGVGGGVSGGQRQRLMIARAVAPKPKILMFDEATSALDNITQKKVSEALDRMKCTRIVIAHRLSTIRHCDRILVLDGGKIVEDGTYEELIAKNGMFADLVERQRLDMDN